MIHAVGEAKSLREHNFFEVLDSAALDYSVTRLGAWYRRVAVGADELRRDQALGVGGTLLVAYEAKSGEHLRALLARSDDADGELLSAEEAERSGAAPPDAKGATQLAIAALEALLYRADLDVENRGLAAMYQWHLAQNPQPLHSFAELDGALALLLTLGIRYSKNVRQFMALKRIVEPAARKIK